MSAIYDWVANCGAGPEFTIEFECLVAEVLAVTDVKVALEIGSFQGRSLAIWREEFNPDLLIGIEQMPEWVAESQATYDALDAKVVCGRSQDPATLDAVKALLGDRRVDFLYLDADHTYDAEWSDINMYLPLVRPGGVMVLDDAAMEQGAKLLGLPTDVWRITPDFDGTLIASSIERTVENIQAGLVPPGKFIVPV